MRKILSCVGLIALLANLELTHAGAPLPSLTFYGMLVDEFGWPYESNVRIEIHSEGRSVFAKSVSPARGRDYNFLVRIPFDSGTRTDTYSESALVPGERIDLKIVAVESNAILINTNFVVSFPPGAVFNVNLTAGVDSVGDGLSDELRRWIWMNTGDTGPFDPRRIRAEDDSDFDGVSNLSEYLAGTDPANPDDVLQLSVSASGHPGVGQLAFYTVPGKLYQIQATDLQVGAAWTQENFANSPTSAPIYNEFLGTGHFVSIFVPTLDQNKCYRVTVQTPKGSAVVP